MRAHLPEYLAELFGTAIMMLIGIGAVTLMFADGGTMPRLLPSPDLRRALTGLLFAGGATLVVLSPLGQRSGGHLNPAVTFAFWWKGKVTTPDALWYAAAQFVGALLGVAVVSVVFGAAARNIQLGLTLPGAHTPTLAALAAEILITFLLVFTLLFCVGHQRFAGHTPYLVGALVALLVFVEAPISGTSLNPARSLAPALLMRTLDRQWIYLVGPPIGALIAVKLFAYLFEAGQHAGCAKLYHTERYRCIFVDCSYRRVLAGTVVMREGQAPDCAYVIERGTLEIRTQAADGAPILLATLGPGDWAGEMALLLDRPRSATVVAATDCELRAVTRENFVHVIAEHPTQTARLLRQLAERLHQADAARAALPVQPTRADDTANT